MCGDGLDGFYCSTQTYDTNAYHNTLDTLYVHIPLIKYKVFSNRIVTSQFNLYVYISMHLSVC